MRRWGNSLLHKPPVRVLPAAVLVIVALLTGCAASGPNYLRGELANEGPQLLSRDNPFLAPNLFVALERDASPLVQKFIAHRGEPDAVEVRRRWIGPLRLYFFYFDKREAFLFEQRGTSWIIRGPEQIPDQIYNQHFLAAQRGSSPALARRNTAPGDAAERSTELSVDSYINDPTEPSFDRLPSAKRSAGRSELGGATETEPMDGARGSLPDRIQPRLEPSSGLQSSGLQSSGLQSSGDVMHTVRFQGETLRMLATWFTGNAENAGRLARINGITNPDLLYLGQQIRVPRYLLVTAEPLPEAEVERYLQRVNPDGY